jgi:hypothetical protein
MRLNDKNKNKLIKEYVRRKVDLLLEQYDDSDYDSGGASYGDPTYITNPKADRLLAIFGLKGLADVARVAIGVGESILTKAFGEAALFIERLWYMINPYYFAMSAEEMENIIQRDRAALDARLDRVHAGYADTVREAEQIIASAGTDIGVAAFLANPGLVLGIAGSRGAVGVGMNLYHRIRYGGSAPSSRSSSRTESSLAARTAELETRARELEEENRTTRANSENVLQNFARQLLGPSGTPEQLRELARNGQATVATPPGEANVVTEQAMPTRAAPTTPGDFNRRYLQLQRDTEQLKQDYIQFLNSEEVSNQLQNAPGVKEGQKALVDGIMSGVRQNFRNITFDKMRNQNPDAFNDVEKESPDIFDSEQKKQAFVRFAKQQIKTPTIEQLRTLSEQNPELANEVNMAVSEVERLANQ